MNVLILGCGYTGKRVRARMLSRGARVIATHRNWSADDVRRALTPGVVVLHSVPPEGSGGLIEALGDAPARVVYLSSTSVYGSASIVDEYTAAAPDTERGRARIAEERRVAAGPWSSLILRPAAIYGPGRGVHERVRRGEPCEIGDNFVSRIHVEDLAALAQAALLSDVCGAYPVADEEPCTSREIAEFCGADLRMAAPRERITNRRVDGSAIRRLLGVTLRYPSYRVGIPASKQA